MTAMVFAIKILAKLRSQLAGVIKFVFQPAEEIVEGAQMMIRNELQSYSLLETPRVDFCFGIHLWVQIKTG